MNTASTVLILGARGRRCQAAAANALPARLAGGAGPGAPAEMPSPLPRCGMAGIGLRRTPLHWPLPRVAPPWW